MTIFDRLLNMFDLLEREKSISDVLLENEIEVDLRDWYRYISWR